MISSGIYAIVNILNDKIYVGSTIKFKSRWSNHRTELNRNIHSNIFLQRSWNKYGEENFIFVILECVWFYGNLIDREQFWIDELNACNDKFGYNIRPRAESNLGIKRSAETRAKISAVQIGKKLSEEHKIKIGLGNKGKIVSEETKARMSVAQTGKKMVESQSIAITAANKRREGTKYNKINRAWSCAEGQKCKCDECRAKKRIASRESKRKRRLIDYDSNDLVPTTEPLIIRIQG